MARTLPLPHPPAALPGAVARFAPLAALVVAALALIVAEFLTLREIMAVTAVPEGGRTSGGAHHGYALAVVGVAALPMSVGAVLGGSRPAALALAVLGALALFIALVVDLPSLNETGLIGRTYDLAVASPGPGFWVELAGAVVLLLGGLALLRSSVVAARERSQQRRAARRAATES